MPSAIQRRDGFSFVDASAILDKAAAVGKLVPVVGEALEGVLQLASLICKDIEMVKSNREDLQALAKDAALCTWAIASQLKEIDQAERSKYHPHIEDLKSVCEDIDKAFSRLGQSGRVQQLLKRNAHESQIFDLRIELTAACTRFGISFHLATKISLDQLRKSVASMAEDIKAIRQKQIDSEIRTSLERLYPVSAAYNSDAVDKSVQYCVQDTRVQLLTQIMDWARDDKVMLPVYWLSGLAGTGKSTVARTVCARFAKEGIFVASFFISHAIFERSDPAQIPRSLAYQIAACSPQIACHISAAIEANPGITTRSISDQVDILIARPLQKASPLISRLVIVIDALDECEKRDGREGGDLLRCIASALTLPILKQRVRLLITSREEATIHRMFSEIQNEHGMHVVLQLHMVNAVTVQADVKLYLEDNLRRISARFPSLVQSGWPSEADIHHLVDYSGVLFVVASTLVRFLDSAKHNPSLLLQSVTENESKTYGSPYDAVDALYAYVLDSAVNSVTDPEDILCRRLRSVLGAILATDVPLSPRLLALFLNEDEVDTMLMLESLRSLLIVIHPDYPVQIFHQSLYDFVTSADRCIDQRLFIDISSSHQQLAIAYMKIINDPTCPKDSEPESGETSEPSHALSYQQKYFCYTHSQTKHQDLCLIPLVTFDHAWHEWGRNICTVQNASEELLHELQLLCLRCIRPEVWIHYANNVRRKWIVLDVVRNAYQWCKRQNISEDIKARVLVLLFQAFFDKTLGPRCSFPFSDIGDGLEILACHYDGLNLIYPATLGQVLHMCHKIWLDMNKLDPMDCAKICGCVVKTVKAIHTMDPQAQEDCISRLHQIETLLEECRVGREQDCRNLGIIVGEMQEITCQFGEIPRPTLNDVLAHLTRVMIDLFIPFLYPSLTSDTSTNMDTLGEKAMQ